jgi:NAD(P)H dehydrogenase (quinone)
MTIQPPLAKPRHVIVLAHPELKSFNASVAETYRRAVEDNGQEAIVRDLYALGFDPVLKASERPGPDLMESSPDVREELDIVAGAEVLVLVYPIWFGMPPAMMKGYIDRVLGYAVTPRAVQARHGNGLLAGSRLVSITSSGARQAWLAEQGQEMSLRTLDAYLEHGFAMKSSEHLHFGGVVDGLSQRFVDQNLYDVAQKARSVCAAIIQDRQSDQSVAA